MKRLEYCKLFYLFVVFSAFVQFWGCAEQNSVLKEEADDSATRSTPFIKLSPALADGYADPTSESTASSVREKALSDARSKAEKQAVEKIIESIKSEIGKTQPAPEITIQANIRIGNKKEPCREENDRHHCQAEAEIEYTVRRSGKTWVK